MDDFPSEYDSIRAVLILGEAYGYGNLITRLKLAWSEKLSREYGLPKDSQVDWGNDPEARAENERLQNIIDNYPKTGDTQ